MGIITRCIKIYIYIHARIQQGEETEHFPKKRTKKWAGWRPRTDEQTIEFKKKKWRMAKTGMVKIWLQYSKPLRLPLVKWCVTRKLNEKNLQSTPFT